MVVSRMTLWQTAMEAATHSHAWLREWFERCDNPVILNIDLLKFIQLYSTFLLQLSQHWSFIVQSPVFGSVTFVFLLSQTTSTLATSEVCFQSRRGWVHMWHLHTNTHWRGLFFWRCKLAEHRWVKWAVFGVSVSWPPAGFSFCCSTLFSSLLHPGVRPCPPSFIMNINMNTNKVHTHSTVVNVILCSPELFTINLHSCMLHFTWQW